MILSLSQNWYHRVSSRTVGEFPRSKSDSICCSITFPAAVSALVQHPSVAVTPQDDDVLSCTSVSLYDVRIRNLTCLM